MSHDVVEVRLVDVVHEGLGRRVVGRDGGGLRRWGWRRPTAVVEEEAGGELAHYNTNTPIATHTLQQNGLCVARN